MYPLIWLGIRRKPDAKKYGWRIGDRIPITSSTLQNDGSGTWVFDVVGLETPGAMLGSVLISLISVSLPASRAARPAIRNVTCLPNPRFHPYT